MFDSVNRYMQWRKTQYVCWNLPQWVISTLRSYANWCAAQQTLALDGADAPITSGDLPADVLASKGSLPESPRQ